MNERRLLADDLARLLDVEPFGLSCCELSRRVRRRNAIVLDVLRSDPRFSRNGDRRGARWRLNLSPRSRERLGTEHRADLACWVTLDAGVPVIEMGAS